MVPPLLSVLSLLLAVAGLTLGNGLLNTLVSLQMSIEGFPLEISGAVMSAYFAGIIAGSLACGKAIERVGHIRAFAALAAALTAAVLLQALFVAPVPWIVLRGATGFCIAGELMVAESWLAALATRANRGHVFSIYMAVIYLAFGSGQFLLTLRDPAGPELYEVVATLLALSIVPVVLTRTTPPAHVGGTRVALGELWREAPLGLVGSSCAGLSMGAVQSLGPRFASEVGLGVSDVSVLMGTLFLAGLVLQWPIGWLSDRCDRRLVLAAMSLGTAAASLALVASDARSTRVLFALGGVYGGFAATLYPLSVAFTNDRVASHGVVAITGGLFLSNGLGATAGPLIAAAAMRGFGPQGLFGFAAVVCAALGAYCVSCSLSHPPAEAVDRFVAVAQTTPVVMELDPRAGAALRQN